MLIVYKFFTFLVYYISLPFTFMAFLFGSVKWKQRLGLGLPEINHDKPIIWLHASSMGEVTVVSVLTEHLIKINSNISVYVTVMTETGYNHAIKLLGENFAVSFFPLDYRSPIKRFIGKINPDAVVFVETEIWPNWVLNLHKADIPVMLANGRLSGRSVKAYSKFKPSMQKILGCYKHIMVQSDDNKERYLSIGAESSKISVLGSMKFDAPVRKISEDEKQGLRENLPFNSDSRIFIAGSTRSGEHELVLKCYAGLKSRHNQTRLILVPRHLEKLEDIAGLIDKLQLTYVRYTDMSKHPGNGDVDVLLVDKIGCLNELYPAADIAFVGGTLVDIGGHNLLEPVWAGVPVLFGPYLDNVRDSAEYIKQHNYGREVGNARELEEVLNDFFNDHITFSQKKRGDASTTGAEGTARVILDALK